MNKPTDVSHQLMRANHYPGTSTPKMGNGQQPPHLPRQRTRRSAKGGRTLSGSPPNYNANADEG